MTELFIETFLIAKATNINRKKEDFRHRVMSNEIIYVVYEFKNENSLVTTHYSEYKQILG